MASGSNALFSSDLSAFVDRLSETRQEPDSQIRLAEKPRKEHAPMSWRGASAGQIVNVIAASIAITLLVATAGLAVIQRATANPADEALGSLRIDEAALVNDTNMLATAVRLYMQTASDARSLSEASLPVLNGLVGKVDPVPLAAAETARAALADASTNVVSISVPAYARGSIDEDSLADVGKAIDKVRRAREALPAQVAQAREARGDVSALDTAFRTALGDLGVAIRTGADTQVAENMEAARSFRIAVLDAADRVGLAQDAGGDGLAEMSAYSAAVGALRAENSRVLTPDFDEQTARQPTSTGRQPTRSMPTQPPTPPSPAPTAEPADPGSSTPDPDVSPGATPEVSLPSQGSQGGTPTG